MKKLALLLALLMMLTVGLFAFTGCGNGNDEPSHDYDNLDDLLDAIYDEANSNLTGNDVMNANMREDEFFYINEYNVRNTTGLTWDRFQTVQEHSYRTNLVMNVANRMTLFRVNGNASEIANWIEADYYSRWNVCAWPDRSFVMYAGDYVLVFSGTTAQATAMQNAFREVLGVQGRLSEFFIGDGTGPGGENDGGFPGGGFPGGMLPDIDFDLNDGIVVENDEINDENNYENNDNGGGLITIQ